MAIAKKPAKISPKISKEKEDKFAAAASSQHNGHAQELTFVQVTLRFEKGLLDRIDAAARREAAIKGAFVNRNAFIASAMLELVKQFEREK